MGARPLFALNLVAFPTQTLPLEMLARILEGGQSKARRGRHPHPRRPLGGRPRAEVRHGGHRGGAPAAHPAPTPAAARATCSSSPSPSARASPPPPSSAGSPRRSSSRAWSTLMSAAEPRGGRGLRLGQVPGARADRRHRLRAPGPPRRDGARGEACGPALFLGRVPILAGVPGLAEQGVVPAGTTANLEHFCRARALPGRAPPEPVRWVLADAQTNGGLLAAVPRAALSKAERALARAGVELAVVGELIRGRPRIDVE